MSPHQKRLASASATTPTIPSASPSLTAAAWRARTATATRPNTPRYISTRVNSRNAFSSESAQPVDSSVSSARPAKAPPATMDARGSRTAGQNLTATPIASAHHATMPIAERSVSW